MTTTAWRLSQDGRELVIYKVDEATRRLSLLMPLRRMKPMTEAEAQKYVDDNYPREGNAVRVAAETLSMARGK